jgi:16S rRNA U516 pseudouridylate synthase RsuA-like enzyme
MRNITLSVDESSYRNVRIAAAHRGTSVSGLVREFFRSLQTGEVEPARKVEELFEVMDREGTPARVGARERDRSKLYDR